MAKSYVTKFTEYVAEQRDNLEAKLKGKGLTPSPNASLGSLVSQIDSLREELKPIKYERDEMLPDFDDMFDNDPLRAVNGGEYLGCAYFLMYVTKDNLVGFYFSDPDSTNESIRLPYYNAHKVVLSDGQEFDKQTGQWTATVGENGIYTDSKGERYCLLKLYRNTPNITPKSASSSYALKYVSYGVKECIDDLNIGMYRWQFTSSPSTYTSDINKTGMDYYRYVGSNGTRDEILNTYSWAFPSNADFSTASAQSPSTSLKFIRVDGNHRFGTVSYGYALKKIIINGEYILDNAESVTVGSVGATASAGYFGEMDYFRLSDSEQNRLAYNIQGKIKNVYIPDSVFSVTFVYTSTTQSYSSYAANSYMALETLHIGNGLTTNFVGSATGSISSPIFYNLRNVTVSPNAFHLNETALTLDFSYAYNLTKESLMNMINNFADRTGMTANVLKLSGYSKGLLSDEEIAILTAKNWTLS